MGHSNRLVWDNLPTALKEDIEARLNASVIAASTQPGGFTSGIASVLELSNGRRAFLKACPVDGPTAHNYAREIAIVGALPASAPAPEVLFTASDHNWHLLCFDAIEGRLPLQPWNDHELQLSLDALEAMAVSLKKSPIEVPTLADNYAEEFGVWRQLQDTGKVGELTAAKLPSGVARRVSDLAKLEDGWKEESAGAALLHNDIRADNLIIDAAQKVWIIDWPEATLGAGWVDLANFLPTIGRSARELQEIWSTHLISRDLPSNVGNSWLAALSGMWLERSLQPDLPHVKGLREHQNRSGMATLGWLQERGLDLGLSPVGLAL